MGSRRRRVSAGEMLSRAAQGLAPVGRDRVPQPSFLERAIEDDNQHGLQGRKPERASRIAARSQGADAPPASEDQQ